MLVDVELVELNGKVLKFSQVDADFHTPEELEVLKAIGDAIVGNEVISVVYDISSRLPSKKRIWPDGSRSG